MPSFHFSPITLCPWRSPRPGILGTAVLAGLVSFAGPAAAQNVTWGNSATDFNAGPSWNGGSAPGSAGTAVFSSTGPLTQPSLTGPITVQALRFQSSGWTVSSSGGAVTVLSTSSGNQSIFLNTGTPGAVATVNADVILGAAAASTQQMTSAAGNVLTLNGTLSSTNSINLSLNNAGTFVLNGANTYTGTTLWNNSSSTTILGNPAAFGASLLNFNFGVANTLTAGMDLTNANKVTNSIQIVANPTFKNNLGYNLELGGPVFVSGTRTITANTGVTTFSGVISGNGLVLAGTNNGRFVFTGDNTLVDGITLQSGTLVLASATTLQGAIGAMTINGGALETSVSATTLGGNLTLSSGSLSLNGVGAGSLTLAAGQAFAMTGGTLNLTLGSSYDKIASAGGGTLTIGGGTILFDTTGAGFSYTSAYQIFDGFDGTSFSALTLTGYDTTNYSAAISSTGDLTFSPSAIPEPATTTAIAGAVCFGLVLLRRRRFPSPPAKANGASRS